MDLAKKEGIILRRLFLLPKKNFLGKEQTLTFTEIIEYICKEENLSYGYTKKIIMECIKNGMIIFSNRDKYEGRKKYYLINKKEIIHELEKDKIYMMDYEIIEEQHSIMIE